MAFASRMYMIKKLMKMTLTYLALLTIILLKSYVILVMINEKIPGSTILFSIQGRNEQKCKNTHSNANAQIN